MNIFKIFLSVLLTSALLISLFSCATLPKDDQGNDNQSSQNTTEPDEIEPEPIIYSEGLDIQINYEQTGCVVVGIGTCTDTDIVIPVEYQDLPVIEIGRAAFINCHNITSITIGNNITTIRDSAFKNCDGLKKVEIADRVAEIGSAAFSDCDTITDIKIPTALTKLSDNLFAHCDSLKNIIIPDGVTEIQSAAFSYCRSLTSITIPNSVTRIGSAAFDECNNLESITLPFVGEEKDGTKNTTIGYIFGLNNENSNVPKSLKNVVITNASTLADSAFQNCQNITSITLPKNLTNIGHFAFYDCRNLEKIVIPKSVKYVGSCAFMDSPKVTISCEADKQPADWDSTWNLDNRPIVWGYTGDN